MSSRGPASAPRTLTATVFSPDSETVLGMSEFVLNGPTSPVFVGFGDPAGIGLVQLSTRRVPFRITGD